MDLPPIRPARRRRAPVAAARVRRTAGLGAALGLLVACASSAARDGALAATESVRAAEPAAAIAFPTDWLGVWRGDVSAIGASGTRSIFQMELAIAATADPARFEWTLRYTGSAGSQVRPYHLVARDVARGEWAIDEGGGVVVEQRLLGGTLWSWFEIGEAALLVRLEPTGFGTPNAALTFELLSSARPPVGAANALDRLVNHPPLALQRARLRRAG